MLISMKLVKGCIKRYLRLDRIVISISAILLFGWCAFNLLFIYAKYIKYETIITLENNRPTDTKFPGITICAPSIFKPQKLAELYDPFRDYYNEYEHWRRTSKSSNVTEVDLANRKARYAEFLKYETQALKDYSALSIIQNLSVRPEELLEDCQFVPVNLREFHLTRFTQSNYLRPKSIKCSDIVTILESIYEGKKCFTLFSDLHDIHRFNEDDNDGSFTYDSKIFDKRNNLNQTHMDQVDEATQKLWGINGSKIFKFRMFANFSRQMYFILNPSIELQINPIEEDIWYSFVPDTVHMTVHPPNILQNRRDFIFFNLAQNNFYDIVFTKKTTQLMPYPYSTKCINYNESVEFRQFRTRDSCITRCIQSKSISKCANYYSVLVEENFNESYINQRICPHHEQDYCSFLHSRQKCEDECPIQCVQTIFEIAEQVSNPLNMQCLKWWNIKKDHNSRRNSKRSVSYSSMNDSVNTKTYEVWSSRLFRTMPYFCNIQISIRISPKPFTIVRHQPSMTTEEIMGTVGGHMGVWLGLSLYAIIKFIVHVLYVSLYRTISYCF